MKHILTITLSVIIYVASGQNPMGERIMAELIDQHQNGTVSTTTNTSTPSFKKKMQTFSGLEKIFGTMVVTCFTLSRRPRTLIQL